MADLKLNIDTDGIVAMFDDFKIEVEQDLMKKVKDLAAQTNAFIMEEVQKLHSTRQTYIDNLAQFKEVAPGVHVATLDQPAMFIEDGLPQDFDMKPGLLKNAKTGKSGIRYKVVPMDHMKGTPTTMTPRQATIKDDLKSALKDLNTNIRMATGSASRIGGTQKDAAGNFVTGRVSTNLNLGGRIYGKGNTPIFDNLTLHQKASPSGKSAKMSAMTFRTVTSNQTDKWIHPGLEPKKIFDKALDYATSIWENKVLPEFLAETQAKWRK